MRSLALLAVRVAVCAGLLAASGAPDALAQEKVGVSSAVNPEASGTPPGAQARRLIIGQEVVYNERITTGEAGQTQLVFLDESSMTVGPNSDLTIDQFVYDPKSGSGKLAMSATKGLLRYVGGKLSKQDGAVTLRSSTATLAVRGGAFIAKITPAACGPLGSNCQGGTTTAVFVYGKGLTIAGGGSSLTITRPGFQSTSSGGPPSAPTPAPPGELAQLLQQLDGQPGGTGGASTVPTDATVVASGIPQTISGNFPQSVQQANLNQGYENTTPAGYTNQTNSAGNTSTGTTVNQPNAGSGQIIDCTTTGTCAPQNTVPVGTFAATGQPVGGTGGVTPTPTPPPAPVTVTYAGRVKNTNGLGTANGFVDQSANGDFAYPVGTLSFPAGSPQQGMFTANVGGSVGTVSFPLVPGTASFQGSSSTLGAISGTSFLSADNTFFTASITPNSQPAQRVFISGGTPVNSSFYQTTGAGLRPQAGSNTRLFAFSVQPDPALQSNIPFVRSQLGGNLANATVSPLYMVAPPTTAIGDATTVSAARTLQSSLAINGQGANQQSVIGVMTGTVDAMQSNGRPILNGAFRGSSQLSANGTPTRIGSAVSSVVDGAGNSFYGGNTVSGFVVDQTQFNSTAAGSGVVTTPVIPSTASEIPLSGAANNYGFTQAALPQTVPSGVGASRTTQALSGNFGGLMYTTAQTNPYAVTGGAVINTDAPNNRIQATLAGTAQTASSGVNSVTMQYGALTGNAGGREAFIDDKTFAVLESQVNPQQINGQNLVVNGDPNQAGKLYLVSSGAAGAPTSLLPAGTSYCQCQYLQWGYWGGDLRTGNSADATISRVDRGHINTWVAGTPTAVNDINSLISQSATGTYTGHAIGSVFNNGSSYVAAGGFNGTYNFGTQSGTMTISNFDGHTFSATGKAPLTGPNYSFNFSNPGATGAVNGTFYGPQAAETGGNFAVQTTVGPTYMASGIYAGKR